MNQKQLILIIIIVIVCFLSLSTSKGELKLQWFIPSNVPQYPPPWGSYKIQHSINFLWLPQQFIYPKSDTFESYILKIEANTGKIITKYPLHSKLNKIIQVGNIYNFSNELFILPSYLKDSLYEVVPPSITIWDSRENKIKFSFYVPHPISQYRLLSNTLAVYSSTAEIYIMKVNSQEFSIREIDISTTRIFEGEPATEILKTIKNSLIKEIVYGDEKNILLFLHAFFPSPFSQDFLVNITYRNGYIWIPTKWLKLEEGNGMWIKNVATSGGRKEGYYLGEKGLLKIIDLQNLEIKKEKQIFKKPIQITDALSYNSRRIITVIRYSRLEKGRGGLTAETYSFPYIVVINPKTFQKEWELVVKGEVKKPTLSIKGEKVFFWVYNREKDKSYLCGIDIRKKQVLFCEETDNTLTIPPLVVGNTLITLWKPSQGSKEKEGYKAFEIPRSSLPSSFSQGIIIERKEGQELEFPKEEMFEKILDKK